MCHFVEGSVLGTCRRVSIECASHTQTRSCWNSSLGQYGVGIVTWIACDHCKLHVWYQLCSIRAHSHCFSLVSSLIPFVREEFGVPAYCVHCLLPKNTALSPSPSPSLPLLNFTLLFQETQSHMNDCCYALPPSSIKYALPEMSSSQAFIFWKWRGRPERFYQESGFLLHKRSHGNIFRHSFSIFDIVYSSMGSWEHLL